MFVCSVCVGNVKFPSADLFLAHYQFYHEKLTIKGPMVCSHTDCFGRKFDKFNSFRKHVKSHRCCVDQYVERADLLKVFNVPDRASTSSPKEDSASDFVDDFHRTEFSEIKDSVNFDQVLTKSVVSFIAELYHCGSFSESQIQLIIDSHKKLLGGCYLSVLKSEVIELLSKASKGGVVTDTEINNVSRMFKSCENIYDGFETHHLRMSEVKRSGAYIPPEPFVIGQAQNEVNDGGFVVIEPIELTGQFIPFRNVLKGFLELPGVLNDILNYVDYLENAYSEFGPIENFMQGKLWRVGIRPKFEGKCVLPLNFSFDDYEVNKELGYHTSVHKLGAGYIKIACLPPKYAALLENIFLAVLFHSSDRALGNDKVFRKVINELKFLEESGILVVTQEGVKQVFFTLALVTGDNLGVNGILGFVESFSANFYCRICSEKKDVMQRQVESNPAKRRTCESYASDLQINNSSLTGRKGECVFNELQGFHVSENIYLDSMHDVDEGVMKYVMYKIIKYLYDKKRFSVDYLNEMVQGFFYGHGEEKNRMPYISKDDLNVNKKIRCSASEMRCFVRFFGLMVGHVVQEEDNRVWDIYLNLRRAVDILTAPMVRQEDSITLKNLIKDLYSGYKVVFKTHLQPKFHLTIHEEEVMEANGPPEPLTCYRTEHKHKEGKDVAFMSNNRINLPFTVAKRHQLRFAFRLISGNGFHPKLNYTAIQSTPVQNVQYFSEFSSVIPPEHFGLWHITKSIEVNGAKYSVGSVVLHSVQPDDTPVFGQVFVISVCSGNNAYFVLRLLEIVTFDKHFHAYEVKDGSKWLFVSTNDLLSYISTDIRHLHNGKNYVPFRFAVSCFRKSP